MSDSEWMRAHGAGMELMGRGSGVPDSLCDLADQVESRLGDDVGDSLIAALGRVLLHRRVGAAEMDRLRAALRSRDNG